jgi:hypothetical protein
VWATAARRSSRAKPPSSPPSYHNRTRSPKARRILDNFREELAYFWMVTPKHMKAPLNPMEGD